LLWVTETTAPRTSDRQLYGRLEYHSLYNRPPPTL
jgi:hypothetical protein